MRCDPYPASKFAIKALRILMEHPGLQASEFAAFCWPHLRKAGLLAALNLGYLVAKGLIKSRFEPPFWNPGTVRPRKRYYVTDKGFTVHEFYARQRRPEEDGNASDHHRTG